MALVIILAIIALFVALEVIALRRMKGAWRLIACIPAAALIVIIMIIVVGILLDPTSHNLWPLEILMWSAGGSAFLGLLFGVRALVKKIRGVS